jgi:hypothetical protein
VDVAIITPRRHQPLDAALTLERLRPVSQINQSLVRRCVGRGMRESVRAPRLSLG